MKKIMFSDKFHLTKAVLDGRKPMTRRIVPENTLKGAEAYVQKIHGTGHDFLDYLLEHAPYKVGEVVAVAQNYEDAKAECIRHNGELWVDIMAATDSSTPGNTNKMFVRADLMPHQIRITNVRVERLQDISDEDCLREGIIEGDAEPKLYGFKNGKHYDSFFSPREAFAALIAKVSGKGVWDSNPFVFVYEFELVK